MKVTGIGRGILVLVGLALLALVIGARPPEPTSTTPTHLGVKPSDMVTLRGAYVDEVGKFIRVYSDGTTQDPFSLPEGKVLVVTDYEPMPEIYGTDITIKVNGAIVFKSRSQYTPQSHFTAGFIVSSPGLLQIEMPSNTQYVILRGYLTDDQ